jgi:hypothetical protein
MSKTAVRISESTITEVVEPFAKARELSVEDAIDKLLHIGWSRLKALANYAGAAIKAPKKAKAPKAAGKKRAAKKVGSKKKAGAGPLAVAAGESEAPAPVASNEPAETDDDFGPPAAAPAPAQPEVTPANAASVLLEPADPAELVEQDGFDPFEDFEKLPEE